jgi:Flp pilus assembly protein CpaB
VENIMSSKLFRTRQGTILLGVVAAVLAAIALIVYLNQYRNSVNSNAANVYVLVAQAPIQAGTSGDVIASSHLVKPTPFAQSKAEAGAITNASQLQGQVAKKDIATGAQLTTADFTATSSGGIVAQLPRGQRAVVVPLDSPGQVGGQIAVGDDVDVYALVTTASGAPVVKEILQKMYVLNTDSNGNVTLRATPDQAGKLIYASGNDKLWLTLRPPHGSVSKPPLITSNALLGR